MKFVFNIVHYFTIISIATDITKIGYIESLPLSNLSSHNAEGNSTNVKQRSARTILSRRFQLLPSRKFSKLRRILDNRSQARRPFENIYHNEKLVHTGWNRNQQIIVNHETSPKRKIYTTTKKQQFPTNFFTTTRRPYSTSTAVPIFFRKTSTTSPTTRRTTLTTTPDPLIFEIDIR
ncbi:uncharacterized protein LOC129916223 [Episyrphus balteatus]|uniref:uncharacterized protein LOC129916223 n=1 Tax=Episyrphus balteatus TaxID=286459 RepID=UPI0024868801|nr:uncharacterized protein LOC129916223 [Episyrphus balteatus]